MNLPIKIMVTPFSARFEKINCKQPIAAHPMTSFFSTQDLHLDLGIYRLRILPMILAYLWNVSRVGFQNYLFRLSMKLLNGAGRNPGKGDN